VLGGRNIGSRVEADAGEQRQVSAPHRHALFLVVITYLFSSI
jgi:hypothetical protein